MTNKEADRLAAEWWGDDPDEEVGEPPSLSRVIKAIGYFRTGLREGNRELLVSSVPRIHSRLVTLVNFVYCFTHPISTMEYGMKHEAMEFLTQLLKEMS